MSDGPRYTNPGNSGSGDDLFRWSGRDGQNGQNNGRQGQNGGDNYIYDGSGRQNSSNRDGDQNHDALSRYRMGDQTGDQSRASDYPQHFVQRMVGADGTVYVNNVYCRNAYFNQSGSDVQGQDYRRDPRQDYRGSDPDCARLQQRQQTGYYDTERSSNGSYRVMPRGGDQGGDYRDMQIEMAHQRQLDMAEQRASQIAMVAEQQRYQTYDRQRQIDSVSQQQYQRDCERDRQQGTGDWRVGGGNQRDCDERLRIQIYNENSRRYNDGRDPSRTLPYYVNDGCFGNGRNNGGYSNGGYNNDGWGGNDRYERGNGGPCFGQNRSGISIRVPLGHNGSLRIGL